MWLMCSSPPSHDAASVVSLEAPLLLVSLLLLVDLK